jgi:hypothetical protein
MAGGDARDIGGRIAAGVAVKVTGTLRAVRGRAWSSAAGGVEVLAVEISEVVPGARS